MGLIQLRGMETKQLSEQLGLVPLEGHLFDPFISFQVSLGNFCISLLVPLAVYNC
jgi:hypothetical protein